MMEKLEWKQKFDKDTLERGRNAYLKRKVDDLKEVDGGYTAAVLGKERFEVSIKIKAGELGRMRCKCPAAKIGRYCEHMAATLYAVEGMTGVVEKKQDASEKKQSEADLMEAWLKMDERLRQEEKKKQEQKVSEEERARRQEQEERRLAREKRKSEAAKKKEEQRQKAEEAARAEYEKRKAEEERREKIRAQKAGEARRRVEKRQREEEEARRLAEKRRKAEERRQAEKRRKEEKERQAEERRKEEERQAEERHREEERLAEEERKKQEQAKLRKEQELSKRLEAEFSVLGSSWTQEEGDSENAAKTLKKLEAYKYFDGKSIRKSMKIPQATFEEGERLVRQGKIQIQEVSSGYDRDGGQPMAMLGAIGKSGKAEFPIKILFLQKEVFSTECGCPECRKDYYSWLSKERKCVYTAGALLSLERYLDAHNIGDATDASARWIMEYYQDKRANLLMSDARDEEEKLKFVPRLTKKDGELSVSFKVGEGKLFVVKKLDEFCENVKHSAVGVYGSSTEIHHDLKRFTEQAQGWIRFINRVVREEEKFLQRLMDNRDYYGNRKRGVGGSLDLFGWRLDEFYAQMADEKVEFEDKDGKSKKKGVLSCAEENPRVTMQISRVETEKDDEFHGILVRGTLPELYQGTDTAYYINGEHLCRVDRDFSQKIEPLANLAWGNKFSFNMGRNHLSEFYYRILPQLQDVVDVSETDSEKIRSYLLPDVRFVFYLDAPEHNVVCRVHARYGDEDVNALDSMGEGGGALFASFRDGAREQEVVFQVMQWLPGIDWEKGELHCGGDEELIYDVMKNGTQRLMELGEVRCTKRFRDYHAIRKMKVSVGVSVSSGLLELDVETDDVSQSELLDILGSYRTKRKYYRLKDGSFLDVDDSALRMLAEMVDTMHLKPKEFIKGKVHLPMYRTLYMDKMLEENEAVYSERDSHFREVVKGFKTVKDADFEVPKSLSRIMRKYQKDGYKWLRTLENWQFGGILADDMGLGKTMQAIAVLLAAKQEGRAMVSLVVSPAALVFNWGEEFARFAPGLNVSLVTGTQEERQEKIEAYKEFDVLVTSYDLLKRDISFYEGKEFGYEVIDEAQYIKNHTTAAAKAVKVVKSRIRYALTGTPIENRLSELWSIFDYLMPGFLYGYDVFRRELEIPIVKSQDEEAMARLQKMVGPFILRRLKEDVLKDLPEKLEESRYVRLGTRQRELYDGQVLHMKERLAGRNEEDFNKDKLLILAELTRLRQICCDPSLCFEDYKGEAAKLEACLQLIQSAMDGGHRMLIFSQFATMLEILKGNLESMQIPYYMITGSTTKEKRLEMVKEFNGGDVPVFLISLKAGGVGLNLTGADVVIHYDPWWNLAVQNQATDRAHRIGQTKKVTVYKLIAKGTIEEKIEKLQEKKKDLAEQVMGGETGQLGSLSREEILELLEA